MLRFLAFLTEAKWSIDNLPTTTKPHNTRFLRADGTRLRLPAGMTHEDAVLDGPVTAADHVKFGAILRAKGILRYAPDDGGIECFAKLTEQQAQVVADDWTFVYRKRLNVDVATAFTEVFDPPVNADKLRRWVNSHI